MTLELDIDQITAAIKHWMKHLSIPIDWDRGITFLAYDGKDDPEPLVVEDLRAHMTIPATGNGQQATVSSLERSDHE